ncbi:Ammonia transport outward protein 2 [Leucoagaricus sp. SymC.cos]|nr:Ammonia transport outward protein 2 [Leucoagaricus sp. SymC.cos]
MSHNDIEKGGIEATTPVQALNGHHASPPSPRPSRIGNPATLGLFSFASTTLILSLYNAQARNIHTPNAVVGMACFCGGLAQLLAGMWEFPRGNAFGGAACIRVDVILDGQLLPRPVVPSYIWRRVPLAPFSSYGAFWLSYATILIPGSGVLAAYADAAEELSSALGIFLVTWMIVTFLFFIASLRKNISFILLFGFLTITFGCLAGGEWTNHVATTKAGGILGCITALIAYYIGLADMLNAEDQAIVTLPLGAFSKKIN